MRPTTFQRAAISCARSRNAPYAIWCEPEHEGFTLSISRTPPFEAPVFADAPAAAFVMAPFDAEDGNVAWHLAADIVIGPSDAADHRLEDIARIDIPPAARQNAPPQVAPVTRETYEARVERTIAAIEAGTADKIVLSRVEPRELRPDQNPVDLVEALSQAHPHAFVCLVSSAATGTWLVATPELLLRADPHGINTVALAGTQWPDAEVDPASLTWSDKIVEEQGFVARFVREAFSAAGIAQVLETAPRGVRAANLCHLRSDFAAPAAPSRRLAELLRRLHPTSAVCGMPREPARKFILREEGCERGFYTGYLGPVHIDGRASLYVNLRSAELVGGRLHLHVGGGIVRGSEPALEWKETVEKTRTIAQVL